MDALGENEDSRLAALCSRMGRLWSEQPIEVWDEAALDNGPWLCANHLVILKPWLPNTLLHCYDFSSCAFWVQVFGLPLEHFYAPTHMLDDATETIPETPQPPAQFPLTQTECNQLLTAVVPLRWQPLAEDTSQIPDGLDESSLQETPVLETHEPLGWAMVAGPKQPPAAASEIF